MELPGTYLEVHPEVGASGLGGLSRVVRFGGVPSHDDSVEVMMVNLNAYQLKYHIYAS